MKVLVVDDDVVCRLAVQAMVRTLGYECVTANDGRAAWDLLNREPIDILVTDWEMPYLSGVELCQKVRAELTRHVYVIVATQFGSLDRARVGMLAGADDYLTKPTGMDEMQLRLIAAERVIRLHRTLEQATQDLRSVARRDPLTGLGNRRCLAEDLLVMGSRAQRYGQAFSIALFDIDYFKAFNDRYGHQQGDEALAAVADVITRTNRVSDTSYRYGGEEFLCLYPEQSAEAASRVVERIRANVAALNIPHEGGLPGYPLTLSAGIADLSLASPDAQFVVRMADTALYEAKRLGRNRVEVEASLVTSDGRVGN